MAHKHRKIRKKRGSRTCGRGSHKKARGAGSRGGRGMAGTHKGKWTWVIKYAPDHFGRRGFKPPAERELETVNLGEIEENLERLMACNIARELEDGRIEVDLTAMGEVKVLGRGKLTRALVVKADAFSARAEEKLAQAGGEAVVPE
ncbi:MAG: 50S ribosomal protein L15 [Euryarchaeota archaeon]|nr:50S ribosomal protein L15 [Euryarchaeota archaeon]